MTDTANKRYFCGVCGVSKTETPQRTPHTRKGQKTIVGTMNSQERPEWLAGFRLLKPRIYNKNGINDSQEFAGFFYKNNLFHARVRVLTRARVRAC